MDGAIGGSGGDVMSAAGARNRDVNFDGRGGGDTLTGGNGNDNFRGGTGSDGITGNGGTDTMIYDDHPAGVTATIGGGRVSGNATDDTGTGDRDAIAGSVERISGTNANDTLIGDNNVNRLDGLAGSDTLQGRLGADTLDAGDGDGGTDLVDYSYSAVPVSVTMGIAAAGAAGDQDTITGFEGAIGSSAGDTLTGDADNNTFRGGGGADTIDPKGAS